MSENLKVFPPKCENPQGGKCGRRKFCANHVPGKRLSEESMYWNKKRSAKMAPLSSEACRLFTGPFHTYGQIYVCPNIQISYLLNILTLSCLWPNIYRSRYSNILSFEHTRLFLCTLRTRRNWLFQKLDTFEMRGGKRIQGDNWRTQKFMTSLIFTHPDILQSHSYYGFHANMCQC